MILKVKVSNSDFLSIIKMIRKIRSLKIIRDMIIEVVINMEKTIKGNLRKMVFLMIKNIQETVILKIDISSQNMVEIIKTIKRALIEEIKEETQDPNKDKSKIEIINLN